MAMSFDRDDLPRAARVIAADVSTVYETVAQVERWSSWVPEVIAPIRVVDDNNYELTRSIDGTTRTHRLRVTGRGPTHTFFAQVDDEHGLYFRTRPQQAGTHVEVVSERIKAPPWWRFTNSRREFRRRSAGLERMLALLATHLERSV
jgi:hypothetical protein